MFENLRRGRQERNFTTNVPKILDLKSSSEQNKSYNRASDISRKKKKNFAGFSGANSRKNWPISRDFRGKKVKIRAKIGRFRGIFAGESLNSQKNRPISRVLAEKNQILKDFQGQVLRKIGKIRETSPRNNQ